MSTVNSFFSFCGFENDDGDDEDDQLSLETNFFVGTDRVHHSCGVGGCDYQGPILKYVMILSYFYP